MHPPGQRTVRRGNGSRGAVGCTLPACNRHTPEAVCLAAHVPAHGFGLLASYGIRSVPTTFQLHLGVFVPCPALTFLPSMLPSKAASRLRISAPVLRSRLRATIAPGSSTTSAPGLSGA